jgi:hypothetical protein
VARCEKCHGTFDAQGAWQKLCWDCWRSRETSRARNGDLSALSGRAANLLDEAYEAGRARGFDEGYDAASADARRRNGHDGVDGALLRELIVLCHPDRHPAERFEQANRVTAQLVSMRGGHA